MSLDIEFIGKESLVGRVPEPIPAYKSFPKWYSQLKGRGKCPFNFVGEEVKPSTGTIKNCPGVTDFLKHGYIIPSWDTFTFRHHPQRGLMCNWIEGDTPTKFSFHGGNQFYSMLDEQKPLYDAYFKIISPWYIKTRPGVSIMLTHPVWHRNKLFTSCTGVYHTDINACQLQWFFEINTPPGLVDDDFDYNKQVVYKNEPVMLVIPFYRDKFKSKVTYLNDAEYLKVENNTHEMNVISKVTNKGIADYVKLSRQFKNLFR